MHLHLSSTDSEHQQRTVAHAVDLGDAISTSASCPTRSTSCWPTWGAPSASTRPTTGPHLDLVTTGTHADEVARLLRLGATVLDAERSDQSLLLDPDGAAFRVRTLLRG
ncbi:MAG: hypothetical protein JWN77_1189 [Frankiales bacterium]|jgi:hypothetical protein|nr:hypothetical protein [Frankiales bacterium]